MAHRRKQLLAGALLALAGLLMAAGIQLKPEGLRTPPWVAIAGCGAFVFAGLSIVARESRRFRAQSWLVTACIAALLVPGIWIAFGPGPRRCSVALGFLSSSGSDMLCRGVFGLGAMLVVAMLVWALVRALSQRHAG